ncbi:hypothetical protein VPHK469_0094 [Vibrio phage K469]
MTKSIIKFKPTVDKEDKVVARDKGWYCQSPDKDGDVLLTEFDQEGGFLQFLADNSVSGDGIPSIQRGGYVSLTSEFAEGNLAEYADDKVNILVDVSGGLGDGVAITAAKAEDYAFNVGVGLEAGARAVVGVYEWDGSKPTKLVGQQLVEAASLGWAEASIDVALAVTKQYCVGVRLLNGKIIHKARANGIKQFDLVGGGLPTDVSAASSTAVNFMMAAYVSIAKY